MVLVVGCKFILLGRMGRSFSVICFMGVIIRDIWLDGKKEIDI